MTYSWVKISRTAPEIKCNDTMKQLDVVVSPPAFLWDPYLTLTNVIFDLDICGL